MGSKHVLWHRCPAAHTRAPLPQTYDMEGLYLPAYKPKRVMCLAFAVWRMWTDLRVVHSHRLRLYYLPSSATEQEKCVWGWVGGLGRRAAWGCTDRRGVWPCEPCVGCGAHVPATEHFEVVFLGSAIGKAWGESPCVITHVACMCLCSPWTDPGPT
jgi:hypothetical protein